MFNFRANWYTIVLVPTIISIYYGFVEFDLSLIGPLEAHVKTLYIGFILINVLQNKYFLD